MSDITFIIPNRGGKNIDFVINQLRLFYPNEQYMVVTQEDNKLFCRGQLFNIGHDFVNTEYMCFIDNDMFFPKYIDFVNIYDNSSINIIQPFVRITQISIDNGIKEIETNKANAFDTGACGGCNFISNKNFEEINGFSNLYCGWGKEDNELFNRVNQAYVTLDTNIYHIQHPRRVNTNQRNTNYNRILFNERNKRNVQEDGYRQTRYNVVYDKFENDIRYIGVSNIWICDGYKYIGLLKKHYGK